MSSGESTAAGPSTCAAMALDQAVFARALHRQGPIRQNPVLEALPAGGV